MIRRVNFQSLKDWLTASARMPLVFLGHGSPMNALEDTQYSLAWKNLGKALPRPQAILVVSAHWMSQGTTLVDVSQMPRTIHDFYGFPEALYQQQYPAKGDPALAQDVVSLLSSHQAQGDDRWGLDHGAWTILKFLYPDADVPVFQVSIDMGRGLDHQLQIGKTLSALRERGVLILGSGNIVHNLGKIVWQKSAKPLDFAVEFDAFFTEKLEARDFKALTDRISMGALLNQAHPTVDHYLPALTIAGASDEKDQLTFMTDQIDLGSVSMKSFILHS